jgi:ubiquinone/menaquinone biosynthesis C-methylase UbiE
VPERTFGTGAGAVFPAAEARMLLNPLRRLLHPPRRLAARLGAGPGDRVLELGCGPGWFSAALHAAVPDGLLVLADLQPPMLERARSCTGGRGAPLATDALALPVRSASIDAAVLAAVLGEVPDPAAALDELARVLRPGGRLLVLESRTDPDFVPRSRLVELAALRRLHLERRWGRLGYTARFRSSGGAPPTAP